MNTGLNCTRLLIHRFSSIDQTQVPSLQADASPSEPRGKPSKYYSTTQCKVGWTHRWAIAHTEEEEPWRQRANLKLHMDFQLHGGSVPLTLASFKHQLCMPLLLSHFSRVGLCDPIDSSPPGSPVPGILQARTLEWVAISFSNA